MDTQLPLNYNFHGMARGDEAITNASPINADFIQYRSIADRGLYFDQNDPHSIGGTSLVGQTGVTYSLYNTLGYVNTTSINPGDAAAFGLDCVHLGIRGQYNRLYDTDSTTNAGPFPGWAPDVATNTNHTGDQVTVLSTPVTVDAATEIGVLYMATDSGGQFDVVLTFNNGIADTNVSVRVAAPDWFGIPADPAIVAGQPVISQKKIVHNVNGTNFSSFTGVSGADSAKLENFVTGGGGPNLNVTEAVIGVAQIIAQGNNVAGQQLTKITFRNAAYPTKTMSALTGDGTTATATFSANHGFLPGTSIVVAGANVAGLNGSYTIANLGGQKAVATLGVTTGTTVSATTAVPHGFAVGNNITIMGATPASFNGTYAITSVPNTTTFNFTNANAVGTASGSIEVGNARVIQYANPTTAASTTGTRTALGLGVGRGYAVYAATVRSGSPTRINCNTPDQVFSGDNQSDNKRTFGATPSGFGSNDTSAAWYAYTANNTGPVEVRTCGASFDTTLAVYGSCVSSAIAGNDNGCGNASRVTWNATSGNTYLIRVAGNNGATGLYNLHIDDPAHADITMPLQFNWNGICHGPSEQTLPSSGTTPPIGSTHENRSDLNGYRSIADRGLLCDGVQTNALNFGGTTGFEGILYNIYATPLQADMIHLGDRSLAAGGGRNWSPPGTNWPSGGGTATTNNGLRPIWLNQDSQPSSTSSMTSLNAVFGPNTKVAFLYHMANGGTSFGSIDVRLDFTDSSSVTATVDATDWFETNTTVMPAARTGVELQRKMGGPWRAVQNTDKADDAGAAAGRLWVNEAVLSTSSLQALGFDANGKTLAAITFGNVRSAPNGAGNAVESAFGVFAATLRDPASFNLNFGPGGTGTVTPNQLVASAAGKITVNVSRGSGSPNNITSVLVDASSVGLSSTFALNDSGIGGDTTPNDNIWSANIAFPVNASSGAFSLPFTVNDAQARTANGNIIFSLVTPNAIVSPTPILAGNSGLVTIALGLDTGANTDINTVSLDGSPLGLGAIALNDSGTGGDATPNDGVWSASLPIPGNALGGVYPCGYTVMDLAGRSFSGSLNVSVIGPPIATDLGTLTNGFTTSSTSISPGEVKWFKFTLSAPVESALLNYLDIDTEGSSTTGGNLAGDTYIGIYDVNGNRISSDDDDGSANFSAISYGATNPARPPFGNGLAYNGRDGALAAGTYYIGVSGFSATFNATEWSVTTTHTHTGTVNVNLALGTVPAGGPPATFVDLGTIGVGTADEPTVVSDERPLPSGGVVWFRFNVPASIDGSAGVRQYFDIDTEDSSIENTVIALFRDDGSGTLVSTDNDDGNLTYSQLTYGRGTRPAVGDGLAYNGRDGAATLTAGTYYLAVTENSASFGSNFIVFFNTGTGTGSVLVNIRSGIQSPVIHGPVTNPANGHKYYLFDVGLSWPQAENFAQSLFDGHLASISDADENEFVRNSVLAHDGTTRRGWIGLNDVDSEGTFVWSDGTPFGFTSWSDGEPNNGGVSGIEEDHIEMFGSNGLWNDVKIDGAGTPGADFAVAEVGGCSADINGTNGVTADDIFAFLDAWFSQNGQTGPGLIADFNRDNAVTADDIFAFLDAWFAQNGVCS